MEIDWAQHQFDGYIADSQRAFQQLVKGDTSEFVVERALDLLRTYLNIPIYVHPPQKANETIVRLAWALHTSVHIRGYWDEICILWPKIQGIARSLPDPAHYAEVTRHLAITQNDRGEGKAAQQLYEELLASTHFEKITRDQQADILHQLGVCYADQGAYTCAQRVLNRCLAIVETASDASNTRDNAADIERRISKARCAAALVWEAKAYTHNQLGHIAVWQGEFSAAGRHYTESLRLFTEHGETHNLACVAYQALGRLLTMQRNYAEAKPLLEQNLVIRRRRAEKKGGADAAVYLADAYVGSRQLADAEQLLNEAMATYGDLHDRRGITLCHFYFGVLEQARENHTKALAQWRRAQKLAATIPVPAIELQVLVALATGLLRAGHLYEWLHMLVRFYLNVRQQGLAPVAAWRLVQGYRR